MPESVQYVTNTQGERVGVLLDLQTYSQLIHPSSIDAECLTGMSVEELEALASCKLALSDQTRLDELTAKHSEAALTAIEITELDDLLAKADRLTILKTRARYTLKRLENDSTAT